MLKHITLALSALVFTSLAWAHQPPLEVQHGFVRAVPPTSEVSAAFMQLHNPHDRPVRLVHATSPASEVVELHTHTQVDGVMQMRRIDTIEVPAQGVTHLQPGGLHLMLIGLKQPLRRDQQVEIQLELEDGSLIELSLPVRPVEGGHRHQH